MKGLIFVLTSILTSLASFGKGMGLSNEKYINTDTFKTVTIHGKFVKVVQVPKWKCWSSALPELNLFEVESFFQNQWSRRIISIAYPGRGRNNFTVGKNYKIIAKLDKESGGYVSIITIPAPPKKKYF